MYNVFMDITKVKLSKKISYLITLFFITFSLTLSFVTFFDIFSKYHISEDFTKISVTFYDDASTSRAFSFFTDFGFYKDNCYVQLDPAQHHQNQPSFKDNDNFFLEAKSETTDFVFPEELRHYTYTDKLMPGIKYFYRVGCMQNKQWSQWGYFITDDKDSSFSFLHITDSQASTVEEFLSVNKALSNAFQTTGKPEFLVSTGDQVEIGLDANQWHMYFDTLKEFFMTTTLVPVSGNHELLTMPVFYHFYLNLEMKHICYSFEYGNAVFIIFDTNDPFLTNQIEWAKNILANSEKQWKIVAFHKAPFSSGTHADDIGVNNIRETLVPILAEYNVDLVLNGHDHIYCRTYPINAQGQIAEQENKIIEQTQEGYKKYIYHNPQGVFYVINRCIGIKFYNKSKSLNDHLIEYGDQQKTPMPVFSSVKIDNNKLIYTAYEYDREGANQTTVIDYFEIIK